MTYSFAVDHCHDLLRSRQQIAAWQYTHRAVLSLLCPTTLAFMDFLFPAAVANGRRCQKLR
jgi:hypothetical protein